jgi:hypothetical protein
MTFDKDVRHLAQSMLQKEGSIQTTNKSRNVHKGLTSLSGGKSGRSYGDVVGSSTIESVRNRGAIPPNSMNNYSAYK